MYKLPYFTEKDSEKVISFIKENYFAVITGTGNRYPVATHIPLEIRQEGDQLILSGHLMKNSDHHKAFEKNDRVLVVFNGPHTYVSASWYTKPASASTWNYMTVHAKGKIRFGDEATTHEAVKKLTNRYEAPESPAAFDKLDPDYVSKLVKAIVSFDIFVEEIDNVFKLSQNHDKDTQVNIARHLGEKPDEDSKMIAREILNRL